VAEGVGGPPADSAPPFSPAALDRPHLLAWREAFRAFGAKRYVCSAEALIARRPPRINALVDRYNAVSMRWAVPVGGEDLDHVAGRVRLVFASGEEPFNGPDEHPRRGVRTRLTESTARAYFVFDALAVYPDESLAGAMDDLVSSLRSGWPRASVSSNVVS
jgi:DNA/RNA-binding domain of Phe-tRNA-synthetase-like protein